jgi:methylenetetrahydrofolate dehydrogenase (NADP+)/methenyltetrahydrofolate cyclohydrolase
MSKKELNGSEVAAFVEDRQSSRIKAMISQKLDVPKLAIVRTNSDLVIDIYLRLKINYANSIGAKVEIFTTTESEAGSLIDSLNIRTDIHGIILQLPLSDISYSDELLNAIAAEKDVDGLATNSQFDPATPTAILWLLAAYNTDLSTKSILIIGQGRLVGLPLTKMLQASGLSVQTADEHTKNLKELALSSNLIITATGSPHTLTADMVSSDSIIVDAGVASEKGVLVGDVGSDIRERTDISVTPIRGGVGPLTVSALFDNLLLSATRLQS